MTVRVRVIGIGQQDRADDAAGLEVARRLLAETGDAIEVMFGAADAAALLAQLDGVPAVILVDCARGGGRPGTILRVANETARRARQRSATAHGNSLALALSLGEALGALPPRLTVFAVVGQAFGVGEPMSQAVRDALPELAARVLREAAEMAGA